MLQQQGKDKGRDREEEEEEEEEYCSPSFRMDSPGRISSALMMSSVGDCEGEEDSSDFSFGPVSEACPRIAMGAAADAIFSDGKIRPAYPLFNRDLLLFPCNIKADDVAVQIPIPVPIPIPIPIPTQQQQRQQQQNENEKKKKTEEESEQITSRSARPSLRRLFSEEEREQSSFSSTSSSSETDSSSIFVDDLYGVPPETYCVWSPGSKAISKKKKKSTSFRWRLKGIDLVMGGSKTNGKDGFSFFRHQERRKF